MSKQKNKGLILKTLKRIYEGTEIEHLVKNANSLEDISSKEIENSRIGYYLTHNLVDYYVNKTLKEENISKIYAYFNKFKISFEISAKYLAEPNFREEKKDPELFEGKIQRVIKKVWQEDDPQLDDCKGPGYLR